VSILPLTFGSALSVPSTLSGLLLLEPCELVSSHSHVRDSLFKGFPRRKAKQGSSPCRALIALAKFIYCKVALTAPTSSARLSGLSSSRRSVMTPMGLASTPPDPFLSFPLLQVSPRIPWHRLHATSAHVLSLRGLTVTPNAGLQRFSASGPVLCPQTTHLLELSCLLLQPPK
jgi:hypothetical protein